jgi:hypothetical protein
MCLYLLAERQRVGSALENFAHWMLYDLESVSIAGELVHKRTMVRHRCLDV